MHGLIQIAYSEEKQKHFKDLYLSGSSEDQMLLRKLLANTLKDRANILPSHGTDWFLCTLAQYGSTSEDTLRVLQSIIRFLDSFHFGIINEKIQYKSVPEIADTCLVGIGFFRDNMERMHQKRAAPSVDYYAEAGALAFTRSGYENIGNDFRGWTNFIERELTLY